MRILPLTLLCAVSMLARDPLAQRIRHNDPAKYRASKAVHGGPGQADYAAMLDAKDFNANLPFLHRGVIQPKRGIGQHFHNQMEEVFVILNGEAQFTVDGRTSLTKGPARPAASSTCRRQTRQHPCETPMVLWRRGGDSNPR